MISDAQREHFREQGYVVVPGVLTDEQIAAGRRIVATMLDQQPPEDVGTHFLWPRLGAGVQELSSSADPQHSPRPRLRPRQADRPLWRGRIRR